MSDKVLIVDDDEAIRKLLVKVLTTNGLEPFALSSGKDALSELKKNDYKLLLLDVMMPEMDGFQVIQQLRASGNSIPVIVISGRNEDYDALYGLDIGADDYIMKPFNPVILGAKVKALIRRNQQADIQGIAAVLKAGPFTFDTKTMRFYKDGAEIILSSKEMQLIMLFLEHPGQVFSKAALYDHVWGDFVVDENAIMVYINHLRNKIESDPKNPVYITTVWGVGYCFSV